LELQVVDLLMPLLRQFWEMWERDECSIDQEHFASAFAREKLVSMLDSVAGSPLPGPEALCVGAPGELHEFGLLAAAIHLSMRGWKVTYLGADLPVDQIEPIARQRRPALLCTSLLTSRSRVECLALAAALRAVTPAETMVVVGGGGLPERIPRHPERGLYFLRHLSDLTQLVPVGRAGSPLASRHAGTRHPA
ncbi:MAG: cobalamin-dependent protein, partial [Gemmatimonadetes bacterium]|nr:cobalamin-dependent protein [Gemmatimonadota bacterium]